MGDKTIVLDKESPIGKWNFAITTLLIQYLEYHGESYKTHNDILGLLTAIKEEWYRRKVAPYEDKKKKENGDVF